MIEKYKKSKSGDAIILSDDKHDLDNESDCNITLDVDPKTTNITPATDKAGVFISSRSDIEKIRKAAEDSSAKNKVGVKSSWYNGEFIIFGGLFIITFVLLSLVLSPGSLTMDKYLEDVLNKTSISSIVFEKKEGMLGISIAKDGYFHPTFIDLSKDGDNQVKMLLQAPFNNKKNGLGKAKALSLSDYTSLDPCIKSLTLLSVRSNNVSLNIDLQDTPSCAPVYKD